MSIRLPALAALFVLFCATAVSADDTKNSQPGYWSGMMGGGWGSGMMGGGNRGYGPGMMTGQGFGPGMMGGCGMMGYGRDASDDDSYADGRIAFLKAELKITAAQSAVWSNYADALTVNSQAMVSMHKQMFSTFKQDDRSALKFLDLHIQAMKSRLAALEALKPVTEALYNALSAEQRKKADDVLPVMGCI
ncbi:MAG: Spy/CpxP family protein refolding chaperone [Parvibaculum sp.]|uniref:Spy/CpxP family protein refolding chaperone n=1 Tax=Parvibaculum sp. TaxID=2024848 RepID=UPI0025FFD255|nr:Spy/CpxP family protein refolding chaperone [Parvibaculum sp.]MCE9651087.1 Spy/CpxP family protein refolding chaperone [Parvibaculum sp.]